ncbi:MULTISPECIES: hypothetical protein [Fervidicoccus]|nr:hypothetical protein [Fervidicoccus fontis]PMB75564.1 MAG: hypothetical protein C0188_02590 [Fervidicoccus fontis]PMB78412.1 MAG: hypothetical protein C0177_00205 [Fervidicoccus fontis]
MQFSSGTSIFSPEVQGILTLVLLAATLALFYYAMIQMSPKKTQEEVEVKTVITCTSTGQTTERAFQKGDYVGKILGECENSGQSVITSIFEVKKEINKSKK